MGHDPFLIKTYPNEYALPRRRFTIGRVLLIFNLKKVWGYIKSKFSHYQYYRNINEDIRLFNLFRARYIVSSEKVYHYEDLCTNPPIADAYITGSDQVWCVPSPIYYLKWGNISVKRLSYAASFGFSKVASNYVTQARKLIRSFDFISVREDSGISICMEIGRDDAVVVPDPTLMLDKTDYLKFVQDLNIQRSKYLFLYLLGNETDVDISDVYSFAKFHSLEVVYVSSQGRKDSYKKEYPTIEEWLHLLHNASYVITNSFHGTVFSLIFEKQFCVLPLSGKDARMNTRISSLLSKYNMLARVYRGSIDAVFVEEISYRHFYDILGKEQEYTKELLQKYL